MMIRFKLHAILGERRMNLSQLQRLTNLPYKVIFKLYHEKSTMVSFGTLEKLCAALGVEPGDLLRYERTKIRVTFEAYQNLTLPCKHAYELAYNFAWVDFDFIDKPEEPVKTRRAQVRIGITETLATMWGLETEGTIGPSENLIKITFEFSKLYLIEKLKDGTLTEKQELWLSIANQPHTLPFDASRIDFGFNKSFEVEIPDKGKSKHNST